jgi:hypothetical protein
LHDWAEDFIADGVHMFKDILGDFQEDDVVLEVFFIELVGSNSENNEAYIR